MIQELNTINFDPSHMSPCLLKLPPYFLCVLVPRLLPPRVGYGAAFCVHNIKDRKNNLPAVLTVHVHNNTQGRIKNCSAPSVLLWLQTEGKSVGGKGKMEGGLGMRLIDLYSYQDTEGL